MAFHYFGGVFRQVRYDNLKSAVKKILGVTNGKRRRGSSFSDRIGALRPSSATRGAGTRKGAWKVWWDTSDGMATPLAVQNARASQKLRPD